VRPRAGFFAGGLRDLVFTLAFAGVDFRPLAFFAFDFLRAMAFRLCGECTIPVLQLQPPQFALWIFPRRTL
jgi:hypothetical protein